MPPGRGEGTQFCPLASLNKPADSLKKHLPREEQKEIYFICKMRDGRRACCHGTDKRIEAPRICCLMNNSCSSWICQSGDWWLASHEMQFNSWQATGFPSPHPYPHPTHPRNVHTQILCLLLPHFFMTLAWVIVAQSHALQGIRQAESLGMLAAD